MPCIICFVSLLGLQHSASTSKSCFIPLMIRGKMSFLVQGLHMGAGKEIPFHYIRLSETSSTHFTRSLYLKCKNKNHAISQTRFLESKVCLCLCSSELAMRLNQGFNAHRADSTEVKNFIMYLVGKPTEPCKNTHATTIPDHKLCNPLPPSPLRSTAR